MIMTLDKKISTGNILTMVAMLLSGAAVVMSNQYHVQSALKAVEELKPRVNNMDKVNAAVATQAAVNSANLEMLQKVLNRIEDKLDRMIESR